MSFAFAIPGDLSLPTGGYAYARRCLDLWPAMGVEARVVGLPGSFPHPSFEDLERTQTALEAVEGPLLIDGLAYGAFPEALAAGIGPRSVALLHHPLCDEQGLAESEAARLMQMEQIALSHARAVIVTSPSTARDLTARFGVPEDKVTVVVPGTDPAPQAPLTGDPPVILAVGAVTPRKGYDLLVGALDACRRLAWRCEIVGATDRAPGEAARLTGMIAERGLADRIGLRGAVGGDDLAEAYYQADLFVAPSRHEGYGMAVVEAMAHGLPVIAARAGALPETAPCAAFFQPDDTGMFAETLRTLLSDVTRRRELGRRCRDHAVGLPDWQATARGIADVMRRVF